MKKYYYAGTVRVAMRTGTGSGTTGLKWLLGDHLDSTNVIANGDGSLYSRLTYKPWGETRTGVSTTTFKFTGQRQNSYINLYWYGSRWYDDVLGRFISPDSIIPDSYNPADWDRYSYVRNNPVNYTDPSGHMRVADGDQGKCKNINCGWTPSSSSPVDNPLSSIPEPTQKNSSQNKSNSGSDPFVGLTNQTQSDVSCTQLTPCLNPWEIPSSWDLNPHDPDYYSLVINFGVPTDPLGGSLIVIYDRYNNWYAGGGFNLGKSITIPNGSLTAGSIGSGSDNYIPDQGNISDFLTGLTVNASGGALGGGGVTWSPFAGKYVKHTAGEWGAFYPESVGISVTYLFKIP